MIKTKDTTADLLKEAEKILGKIEELTTPNLQFQDELKKILAKLKNHSLKEKKSVVAQKIEQVLNELSKVSLPSLFIQKELAKDALKLFIANFK